MELDRDELSPLADFFARRFPDIIRCQQLAREAGVAFELDDDVEVGPAWTAMLDAAQGQGLLPQLADVTAATDPNDENLQNVCALLSPRPERAVLSRPALLMAGVLGAGAMAAVIGLVVGVVIGSSDPSTEPLAATASAELAVVDEPPAAPTLVARALDLSLPTPGDVELPIADEGAAVAASELDLAVAVADSAATVPASTVSPLVIDPEPSDSEDPSTRQQRRAQRLSRKAARDDSRCDGSEGELLGYWYAGEASPGSKGDIITIDAGANVRLEVPSHRNDYDARSPVRCKLWDGERVRLSSDPIEVPYKKYWVPLYAADLITG